MKKRAVNLIRVLVCTLAGAMPVWAQQQGAAAALGYPEMIVHNARIVSMDDASFNSSVGSIVQAMAIRGGKILAMGDNAAVLALAGPATRRIDLAGRTVLPNFILTHEHPTDWAFAEPEAMNRVLKGGNDIMVYRWLTGDSQRQLGQWESVLREAVAAARPGQWVWLSFDIGREYEYAAEIWRAFPQVVSRAKLDQIAPNNPVRVKRHWPLGSRYNSKAEEEIKKLYPEMEGDIDRGIEPDVIFNGKNDVLAQILKAEMELWAAHGITTFGTSAYSAFNFQALSHLDRIGEMPGRIGWSYRGRDYHLEKLQYLAGQLGHGTDHMWLIGAQTLDSGGTCTTLQAKPEVKERESCSFEPGTENRALIEDIIRSGGRIAAMHSGGDKDIDYLMDAIEKASREAGMSIDQIRAKRHAFDHSSGAPRPDQIPRIKNLGMMVSMLNTMLWETHQAYDTAQRAENYGIEYTNWAMPRNSTTKAEVMSTFEIDRPLPHKIFLFIQKGMTRYNDKTKMVYAPGERTDRIIQLKALTTWGGYYLLRENLVGSLEKGKFADFMVLDRDILTIPEDDIPNVKVLMTQVGGKVVHLRPALAQELGLSAVGPSTWDSRPLDNYYAY